MLTNEVSKTKLGLFQEFVAFSFLPCVVLLTFFSLVCMPEKKDPMLVFNYFGLISGVIAFPVLIKLQDIRFFLPMLMFFMFACLSTFWSGDVDLDLIRKVAKRSIAIIFFMLGVCAIVHTNKIEVFLKIMLVVIAACAAYSMYDFYISKGRPVHWRLKSWGSLENSLHAASMYGVFVLVGLHFLLRSNRCGIVFQGVMMLSMLLLFIGSMATQSKGPIISLLICVFALLLIYKARKAMVTLAIVAVSVCMLLYFEGDIVRSLIIRGDSHRLFIWMDAINKIKLSPWFGHGMGAQYLVEMPILNARGEAVTFVTPHSRWLAALFFTGVIGFLLLLYSLLCPVIKLGFYEKGVTRLMQLILFYSAMCGVTQGVGWITNPDHIWFMFWFPWAALVALASDKKRKEKVFVPC
ncbi:O-antigen ligase family protein [Dasania marina]|uniref:O-antigen ligase family protein n=1 Tax=Dasania marina TaxID=471499 RepID=UPI0030D862E2